MIQANRIFLRPRNGSEFNRRICRVTNPGGSSVRDLASWPPLRDPLARVRPCASVVASAVRALFHPRDRPGRSDHGLFKPLMVGIGRNDALAFSLLSVGLN